MRSAIVCACAGAVVLVLLSATVTCAGCITCKTDNDCGSMGVCVHGRCQSPPPGR